MWNIITPVLWLAGIGLVLGALLAFASKIFAVKEDERIGKITECLPGANCGGCGYAGCNALAHAIVEGKAKINSCGVGGAPVAEKIADIMGVEAVKGPRLRAQVMCSGTSEFAHKKYVYAGAKDCNAAVKLGGGDKLCPNGCIGLGTCVKACKFDAISVVEGVAVVDYHKCRACGACTFVCPKNLIKLIPYESHHWVGCRSVDNGATTRKYCDVGCISCRMCEKACEAGAIKVTDYVASIDYSKCTGCDKCIEKCPRKIIWSATKQADGLVISRVHIDSEI